MLKNIYTLTLIIALILLSACQSAEQIKPIKEETVPFDISTATEMIKKKEKMIIELAMKDKVSKEEYAELEVSFTEEFGDHARSILEMLFINSADPEPPSDTPIYPNSFYPTLFHEGISLTAASVYNSYYENEFLNQTRLTIKEEYVGEDEKLKDWNREYIFDLNEHGEWKLKGFSGVMNFSGEEFSMHYLKLAM